MAEKTPIIYVVDDDEGVRKSLQFVLKTSGLLCQVIDSAQAFLKLYDPEQPGCLVLDVRMPGMSGLELQQQLNVRGAVIPVIFITGHGDIAMAVDAMQHGAFDFVTKPFRDQDILDRINRALIADKQSRIGVAERSRITERLKKLTPRERDVMNLMVLGKPNKVIAGDLGLSQRTVEIHRARVMEKSQARSLAQLVRMTINQ